MSERHCFSSLPVYLWDLPRRGPVSRTPFETAPDAAGYPFEKGEPCTRAQQHIDVERLPSKRRDPLASFDRTGVATGAPLTETRALHVDDHVRRACSEPPRHMVVNGCELLTLQTFGVCPGIGSPLGGRRRSISPEFNPPSRAEASKRALQYGDIVDVGKKRHFPNAAPGTSSPRLAAVAVESIDIDQRAGKKRPTSCQPPSKGILPLDSPSFSMECKYDSLKASPRRRSLQYFEKVLETERYAQLIGRPHAGTEKEIQRELLALELQRQKEEEEASPNHIKNDTSRLSFMTSSTTASAASDGDGSGTPMSPRSWRSSQPPSPPTTSRSLRGRLESPVPLSAASRSALANGRWKDDEVDDQEDAASNEAPRVQFTQPPLGVRRMMASLMPNSDCITEDLMDDFRAALSMSMKALGKQQGNNGQQRNKRFGCSPPRRLANRRNDYRR